MTVDGTNNRTDYDPDGSTTTFIYDFRVDNADDMVVYADGSIYANPFTITGVGNELGGDVVFDVAPVSGIGVLTLIREVPLTQQTSYPPLGPFPAESHEAALDKLTFIDQQLQEQINRAGVAPVDASPSTNYTLPKYASGEFWYWDLVEESIKTADIPGIISSGKMRVLNSISSLRSNRGDFAFEAVQTISYGSFGDKGGGVVRVWFEGYPAETFTDDSSSTIVPTGGNGSEAWVTYRLDNDVRSWGVTGGGLTDDRDLLFNCDSNVEEVVITEGTYLISSNLTFTKLVTMKAGAVLVIPTGVTVRFDAGFIAPDTQKVFNISGTGEVTFNTAHFIVGYPEWWGGKTGGSNAEPGLTAGHKACPVLQLHVGDYALSNTFNMTHGHRTVRGVVMHWEPGETATRLVIFSATQDCVYMHGDTNVINDMPKQMRLEHLELSRSTAQTPPAPGSESDGAAGLRCKWLLYAYVNNVRTVEHFIGFFFEGTVSMHLWDCFTARSQLGSTPTNDQFFGYWIDGTPGIGTAGGNASFYMRDCNAAMNIPALTTSIGLYCDKSFTDTWILNPEIVGFQTGIRIVGQKTGSIANQRAGNIDFHIYNPIVDQFTGIGIHINAISDWGQMEIIGGVTAPTLGGTSCFSLASCTGLISLTNHQMTCWPNTPCVGISLSETTGYNGKGNQIVESSQPIIMNSSSNNNITASIRNTENTITGPAVTITDSDRNYVAPMISAVGAKFGFGIAVVDLLSEHNEFNCTGIDATALTLGSARKMYINNVSIPVTGLSGTNLVSGVMT